MATDSSVDRDVQSRRRGNVIGPTVANKTVAMFCFFQCFACNLGDKIAVNKQKYMVERPISHLCNGIGIKHQDLFLGELWLVL